MENDSRRGGEEQELGGGTKITGQTQDCGRLNLLVAVDLRRTEIPPEEEIRYMHGNKYTNKTTRERSRQVIKWIDEKQAH